MLAKFRFRIDDEMSKDLISLYNAPWRSLLSRVFVRNRHPSTYREVSRLHRVMDEDFSVRDLIPTIREHNPEGASLLSECHLILDRAPFEMRTFIVGSIAAETLGTSQQENFA